MFFCVSVLLMLQFNRFLFFLFIEKMSTALTEQVIGAAAKIVSQPH